MSPSPVFLHEPRYALGEIEVPFDEVDGLSARAEEFRMVPEPGLWGWGSVFRTERGLAAMAVDSALATLRGAGVEAGAVDALLVCCTHLDEAPPSHGRFVGDILAGVGLGDIPFHGLNFNRCVNLLAALEVAASLVAAGRYRRVLVVTTDRAMREADRLVNYALFSDGAASVLVSAGDVQEGECYELLSCATAQDVRSLDWTNEISPDLARRVNDRLLGPLGMKLGDVAGLMHGNIFKPLVVMKERQAGFTPGQIWTGNIARVGHCFAADPLINLADRAAAGHVRPGGHYVLAASVPGSRVGVLVRKTGDRPPAKDL